jgi:hypothetical protein
MPKAATTHGDAIVEAKPETAKRKKRASELP